jgi:hypothetical protein
LFDVGNSNRIGAFILEVSEEAAVARCVKAGHVKAAKNARPHEIPLEDMREDTAYDSFMALVNAGKCGHLCKRVPSYNIMEVLQGGVDKGGGEWLIDEEWGV